VYLYWISVAECGDRQRWRHNQCLSDLDVGDCDGIDVTLGRPTMQSAVPDESKVVVAELDKHALGQSGDRGLCARRPPRLVELPVEIFRSADRAVVVDARSMAGR
jgi:hypothetical protein